MGGHDYFRRAKQVPGANRKQQQAKAKSQDEDGDAPKTLFSGKKKKEQLREERLRKELKRTKDVEEEEREKECRLQCFSKSWLKDKEVIEAPSKNCHLREVSAFPSNPRSYFGDEAKDKLEERKRLAKIPFQCIPLGEYGIAEDDSTINIRSTVIDMPVRPQWKETDSVGETERREQAYFDAYVASLWEYYGHDRLNNFELNINVWRQLWRVIERSDILVVMVDIRCARFNFPPALYRFLAQTDPPGNVPGGSSSPTKKPIIIVLNKVDLVPARVAQAWVRWYKAEYPGVHVVPFTSQPASETSGEPATAMTGDSVLTKQKMKVSKRIEMPRPRGEIDLLNAVRAVVDSECPYWDSNLISFEPSHLMTAKTVARKLHQHATTAKKVTSSSAPIRNISSYGDIVPNETEDNNCGGDGRSVRFAVGYDENELKGNDGDDDYDGEEEEEYYEEVGDGDIIADDSSDESCSKTEEEEEDEEEDEEEPQERNADTDDAQNRGMDAEAEFESEDEHSREDALKFVDSPPGKRNVVCLKEATIASGELSHNIDANTAVVHKNAAAFTAAGDGIERSAMFTKRQMRAMVQKDSIAPQRNGERPKFITLGMIGHPNAGKSSIINALAGKKVVSVSRTPGHTKHLQTIFLNPYTRLCDCPGLVFPMVDIPYPLQILCGQLKVAQVRDTYSTLAYVGARFPLDRVYGLTFPTESVDLSTPDSSCPRSDGASNPVQVRGHLQEAVDSKDNGKNDKKGHGNKKTKKGKDPSKEEDDDVHEEDVEKGTMAKCLKSKGRKHRSSTDDDDDGLILSEVIPKPVRPSKSVTEARMKSSATSAATIVEPEPPSVSPTAQTAVAEANLLTPNLQQPSGASTTAAAPTAAAVSISDRTSPQWSGYTLAEAWATKKGYLTKKLRPDTHRAGNEMLRDLQSGKVLFAMAPPKPT